MSPVSYIQRSCTDFIMNKKKRGVIVSKRKHNCLSFLTCCIKKLHLVYSHSRSLWFTKTIGQENKIITKGKSNPLAHLNFFTWKLKSRHCYPNLLNRNNHHRDLFDCNKTGGLSPVFGVLLLGLLVWFWGFFESIFWQNMQVIYQLFHYVPVSHQTFMEWRFSSVFGKRWSSTNMKHAHKMLFCSQMCEVTFRDVLFTILSTALLSVARGFLNWLAMASQIYTVPDRSLLLLLYTSFKILCCISPCNFFSNYLFHFVFLQQGTDQP